MDFSDQASAIDDSYEAIDLYQDAGPGHGRGGPPLTQEIARFNGPRSGHWTVKSTLYGSGIDDGCPTVYSVGSFHQGPPGRIQPIGSSVVDRLAKATLDEKKAAAEAKNAKSEKAKTDEAQKQDSKPKEEPKGFFVPKIDRRGIRIRHKDGRIEVMKYPIVALPTIQEADIVERTTKQAVKPRAASPAKTAKAMSVVSHTSSRSRGVRIVGKDGRELYMPMPNFRSSSQSTWQVQSAAKEQARKDEAKAKATQQQAEQQAKAKKEKVDRDAKAANAAKQMCEERFQEERRAKEQREWERQQYEQRRREQQEKEQERQRVATTAANAMMSGALPASSRASKASSFSKQASVYSVKASSKQSGVSHGVSRKDISKPPSMASSNTSIARSQLTGSMRTVSQPAQKTPSQRPFDHPAQNGWQEVGWGMTGPAPGFSFQHPMSTPYVPLNIPHGPPLSASDVQAPYQVQFGEPSVVQGRMWKSTPVHSFAGASGFQEIKPSSRQGSNGNWQPSDASQPLSDHPPTIYAGKGWISPHPLSVAPSEAERPPQPAIRIPSGGGVQEGMMTYDEWRGIQRSGEIQATHSRTSSNVRSHAAGSWGHRMPQPPLQQGPAYSQGQDSRYMSPMVESMHSSRHQSMHSSHRQSVHSSHRQPMQGSQYEAIHGSQQGSVRSRSAGTPSKWGDEVEDGPKFDFGALGQ